MKPRELTLHKTLPEGRQGGEAASCRPRLWGGSVSALPFVCDSFPRGDGGGGALPASPWPLSLLGPRQARRRGPGGCPGKIRPPAVLSETLQLWVAQGCQAPWKQAIKRKPLLPPSHTVHLLALCKASSLTAFQRGASECHLLPPSLPKARVIISPLQLQGFSSVVTSELTLSLWPDQGNGFCHGKSDF